MQPNTMQPYGGQQPVQTPPPNMGVPVQLPKDPKPVGLIVAFVVTLLLFVATLVFAIWAFGQMQDYKNNSDKKSAAAVTAANAEQKKTLDAEYAEKEKSPYTSYTSPSQFGSVKLVYPKTWSGYVSEGVSSGNPVDGFFNPAFVPDISGDKNSYILRIQVTNQPYQTVLNTYNDEAKQGKVTVTAFKPEQVKDATAGVRLDGQINNAKSGAMVILPLRDKTLKIWTENPSALNDFNNTVLKNLTYSP
jgi:hypothetical protein